MNILKMSMENFHAEADFRAVSRQTLVKSVGQALAAAASVSTLPRVAAAGEEDTEGVTLGAAAEEKPVKRITDFEAPYNRNPVPLTKFLKNAKAILVVNSKLDDPVSLQQMPPLVELATRYSKDGLRILVFPTDQGTFEPDDDETVRIKNYQFYGFGQYPVATVMDKIDIVGTSAHPIYKFLCSSLPNPYGVKRITLNYEKFLLNADGVPVRRYPRKMELADYEKDVQAVLKGEQLPDESLAFRKAWVAAKKEAAMSEYAFRKNLNYYDN
eukprot:CAMPEP_0113945008 /NCGR_PEP_ID=MMETSP1339-20121228/38428_1 /TAXON_ID=94617 /ORGANISM="Fibrocapsa japonica" /LENGTH=269 /DNA_ID=CAMNT_0000950395 /DNA_START=180 /DNA_END=989 /DNA_ORIENTATION=+ /assembly_acc=CAM_ASM_000762